MGQSINSIKEFEQRSPQLGYISSFNTCSHVKSSLMHNPDPPKIMHERDFYMGTCLEGDSAHSLAWRGPRGDLWRSAVGMTLCHFCSLTSLRTILKLRKAKSEGTLVILFFCCFYSRQCTHRSSSFLLGTEVRGLDRRWMTGRKCRYVFGRRAIDCFVSTVPVPFLSHLFFRVRSR